MICIVIIEMRANRRIKYTSRANGTFELLYTFVSRRANRSVMYIREARKGVENPWSLPDPTGTFKVLSFRWQPNRFSLSLFSAFPLVFFLLSPSTHIRWRIVLLKRVLLTNGSLFLSFSAFSFFLFFFSLNGDPRQQQPSLSAMEFRSED